MLHQFLGWYIAGVAKSNLAFPLESLTFLSIIVLSTFWSLTIICVVYSELKNIFDKNKMELTLEHNFLQLPIWIINTSVHLWTRIFAWRWKTGLMNLIFNCGWRSLKVEVREDSPKTAVVSKNIDAVREQILPDRHVTYREIETSLDISFTCIH